MTETILGPRLQVGQRASFSKTVTESDVSSFAGLIGDLNPIHIDAEYARKTRFGRRVAQGMLAGGLISAVLSNKLPGPGAVYLSQQIEFLGPIFIGDTITACVEILSWQPEKRLVMLRTECYNQDDRQVITGQAVMLVESAEE